MPNAMWVAIVAYLWILVGDLLLALRPWEPEDRLDLAWARLSWPNSIWWVLRRLISDWRTDLYRRTKYY